MNPIRRPLLLAAALLALSDAFAATVFYVSPDGDDAATGSREQPFATLERALAGVAATAGDVEVRLRSGTYPLPRPLVITPAVAGSSERSITLGAEKGEKVRIVGSRRLVGAWVRVPGERTLWRLDVPEARDGGWVFRSLFRNGVVAPRAKEPDAAFWSVQSVDEDRKRLVLAERLPGSWSSLQGVELNTTAWWHFNRQPVAAIGADSVSTPDKIGTQASSFTISDVKKAHPRVWLENALEFADEPGEWFLDTKGGVLFYRAGAEEDPNAVRFSAPVLTELLVVQGTPEALVRNVHLRDLHFAETDWVMPKGGRLGVQAGAWAFDRQRVYSPTAAVRFIYAWRTSVTGCRFTDLGEGGVSYEIGTRSGAVLGNTFERVGSNSIQVGRMPEYTGHRHPLHRDFEQSHEWVDSQEKFPSSDVQWRRYLAVAPQAPSQVEIEDNSILDCGWADYGSVGIWVGYANFVRIRHNLLSNLPYTGISVGWRWATGLTNCHSNLIERNRIAGVMRQVGDGAGIYLVGEQPGTRIIDNYVTDSSGSYWAHGIYTDEASDHMEIRGNFVVGVAHHSLFRHKNGRNQTIADNNGVPGATVDSGANERGVHWVDFRPENKPSDPARYGPRKALP